MDVFNYLATALDSSAYASIVGQIMDRMSCPMSQHFFALTNKRHLELFWCDFDIQECTRYGRVEILEFLYEWKYFECAPLIQNPTAPPDETSDIVMPWLMDRLLVNHWAMMEWAIENDLCNFARYLINTDWYYVSEHSHLDIKSEEMMTLFFEKYKGDDEFIDWNRMDKFTIVHWKWILKHELEVDLGDISYDEPICHVSKLSDPYIFKAFLLRLDHIDCTKIVNFKNLIPPGMCDCTQSHRPCKRIKPSFSSW